MLFRFSGLFITTWATFPFCSHRKHSHDSMPLSFVLAALFNTILFFQEGFASSYRA